MILADSTLRTTPSRQGSMSEGVLISASFAPQSPLTSIRSTGPRQPRERSNSTRPSIKAFARAAAARDRVCAPKVATVEFVLAKPGEQRPAHLLAKNSAANMCAPKGRRFTCKGLALASSAPRG